MTQHRKAHIMMNTNNRFSLLYLALALFALYLAIKWTCRLIFGLFDYALLIGAICAVVWYLKLPVAKRKQINNNVKARLNSIFN